MPNTSLSRFTRTIQKNRLTSTNLHLILVHTNSHWISLHSNLKISQDFCNLRRAILCNRLKLLKICPSIRRKSKNQMCLHWFNNLAVSLSIHLWKTFLQNCRFNPRPKKILTQLKKNFKNPLKVTSKCSPKLIKQCKKAQKS